jgi:hypothetical protein
VVAEFQRFNRLIGVPAFVVPFKDFNRSVEQAVRAIAYFAPDVKLDAEAPYNSFPTQLATKSGANESSAYPQNLESEKREGHQIT